MSRFSGFTGQRMLLLFVVFIFPVFGICQDPDAPGWKGKSWTLELKPEQTARLTDGKLETGCGIKWKKDFGIVRDTAVRINQVVVHFASLHGGIFQPRPGSGDLQILVGGKWQTVAADVDIDYSGQQSLAPMQKYGSVKWTYRFAPKKTSGVRIRVKEHDELFRWFLILGYRGVIVQEIKAGFDPAAKPLSGKLSETPKVEAVPEFRPYRDSENLTGKEWSPVIARGKGTVDIQWPRPRMISMCRLSPEHSGSVAAIKLKGIEWWDGERFHPVEEEPSREESGDHLSCRFLPLATTRLRVKCQAEQVGKVDVFLDKSGSDYLKMAKESPQDVLANRALDRGEPTLAGVRSLLLPANYMKAFTGRVDDISETLITWNGTLISRYGKEPSKVGDFDRFIAFGMNGRLLGENPDEITRSLIDGWLPGVIHHVRREGISADMTVFTTAAEDPLYADRVHWEFKRGAGGTGLKTLEIIPGKRMTCFGYYGKKGGDANPAMFAPLVSGFFPDEDGRTVRDSDGTVLLISSLPGEWKGTALEPVFSIPLEFREGEEQLTLDLLVPHVDVRRKTLTENEKIPFAESLDHFRKFWERKTARAAQFTVPEQAVNDIARNALCQLLIFPDDGVPHYGSYWYEWCIGLEEWWPTLALAQFGYAEEAKTNARAIIERFRKPAGHHFPYRNGLAGAGAAKVARLTGDLDWYRSLSDNLRERAEWTIRSGREGNKGTEYAGLIQKFSYGGDVRATAHSLYSNVTSWRGLRDTAEMFDLLGEKKTAEKYRAEAKILRKTILDFWSEKIDHSTKPPFVPYAFDIGKRGVKDSYAGGYQEVEKAYRVINQNKLGGYWNLFMQMLLEQRFYPPGRPEEKWIREYCEQHGGLALGLTRYETQRVDWHYGVGYIKSLLWAGERERFLLSFYSALSHGAATDSRTSGEDNDVWWSRVCNVSNRFDYATTRWTWQSGWDDAISAPPGVILQLLRVMLVDEGDDGSGEDGRLILLSGIPRRWLEDGKEIHISDAPTHFGKISLEVESKVKTGSIHAVLKTEARRPPREIVLKMFHPGKKAIQKVSINGKEIAATDGETISFSPEGKTTFAIEVSY